jgi:uncharacterized protein (TIGR03086 family)
VRTSGCESGIYILTPMAQDLDITTLRRACGMADRLLSGVGTEQLADRTPCSDWTVQELMEHVVGGADFLVDVAELGASPDDREWPDYVQEDLAPAFQRQAERLVAVFGAEGAMTKPMRLPSGETSGAIAIQVAIGELCVHSWDPAKATGQAFSDDGTADALQASDWPALCEIVRADSSVPFAAVIPSDGDVPKIDQLVAFLGRDPHFVPH